PRARLLVRALAARAEERLDREVGVLPQLAREELVLPARRALVVEDAQDLGPDVERKLARVVLEEPLALERNDARLELEEARRLRREAERDLDRAGPEDDLVLGQDVLAVAELDPRALAVEMRRAQLDSRLDRRLDGGRAVAPHLRQRDVG